MIESDALATSDSYAGRDKLQDAATATIEHFVDALQNDEDFETSLTDNLKTLRIVEAAYRFGEA